MGKVKGITDIVFLMDATSDMMNCIQKVKENLVPFFEAPTADIGIDHIAARDWRAKVVGFRDFEADGAADWFVDNRFTRDIMELEWQFDTLEARGGGDWAKPLLDAIYTVAAAPKSAPGTEDPRMWRDRKKTAREVIVFTDAPFKPIMAAPGCKGGTWEDVRNICIQEKIRLTVVAPSSELPGYERFEYLGAIYYANYLPIRTGNDCSGLGDFVNDRKAFREIMRQIMSGCVSHMDFMRERDMEVDVPPEEML